jgi:competence protein ComEC
MGHILVVDGGPAMGSSDRGRLTVGPFLKTLGVSSIDCLAVSHADADHIGGIPYLLQTFGVKMMLEGADTADTELYRKMRGLERTRHVPLAQAGQGGMLGGFDPVRVRLLGPTPGGRDNNASVVLLLDYHDVQILLTGDLEASGERQLIQAGLAQDIEVLKLGHHGSHSSTSEDFLNAVKPEAALISVGKNNRYGHPSPDVLARLQEHGIADYRTDQFGALWLRTDGHRIRIYRFAGE